MAAVVSAVWAAARAPKASAGSVQAFVKPGSVVNLPDGLGTQITVGIRIVIGGRLAPSHSHSHHGPWQHAPDIVHTFDAWPTTIFGDRTRPIAAPRPPPARR